MMVQGRLTIPAHRGLRRKTLNRRPDWANYQDSDCSKDKIKKPMKSDGPSPVT
jgi:hypothetical protein